MASIQKQKGKANFYCMYRDSNGKQHCRSTKTTKRKEAEQVCQRLEYLARKTGKTLTTENAWKIIIETVSGLLESVGLELPSATVDDYLDQWMRTKKLTVDPGTYRKYGDSITAFRNHLGKKANGIIPLIAAEDIRAFQISEAERTSPGTANFTMRVIKMVFKQAFERDHVVPFNPTAGIAALKTNRSEKQVFSVEKIQKVLSVAPIEWQVMTKAGFYTGMRLGDIANLKWSQVELTGEHPSITKYTTKTQRPVVIPIHPSLRDAITDLPSSDSPDASVFPRLAGKRSSTLSNQFYRLMSAAGIVDPRNNRAVKDGRATTRTASPYSFHSLRHTATSELKNRGVSGAIAEDIIGHESTEISRNYTHIDLTAKEEAVNKLPAL
jgi:integrase